MEPIRVTFDRAIEQASVSSRFRVSPRAEGAVVWESDRSLSFLHAPFRPAAEYEVILEGGYRDQSGRVNGLRHSWRFRTEAAPELVASSPAARESNVDPAAYLNLSFTREMDPETLAGALAISPEVALRVRVDPADVRRVMVAPQTVLDPDRTYTLSIDRRARDTDGNPLRAALSLVFTTGPPRPLRHAVTFIADPARDAGDGALRAAAGGAGIWMVDENRFPRRLVAGPVSAFAWSQDGRRLLYSGPGGDLVDQPLGGEPVALGIRADWAAHLAPGRGFAYLDSGRLQILEAERGRTEVARGVGQVALAPGGTRLAYTVSGTGGDEIWAYDIELRAHYRLQTETHPVDGLAWSPDGLGLAYRLKTPDPGRRQLRVRSLGAAGSSSTVTTGDVSEPTWQADSRHLVFTGTVPMPGGAATRAFRLPVGEPAPRPLTPGIALPPVGDLEPRGAVASPDGHQIAFMAGPLSRSSVWLMNANGTRLTRLAEYDPDAFPYSSRGVAWTPL